jgi:hypothetical protein
MKTFMTAMLGLTLGLAGASHANAQRRYADDRISFEVLRSREVIQPCGEFCGDHGFRRPNDGLYRVETRLYSEWLRGRLVRTWTAKVDVFVECVGRRDRDGRD